MTTNYIVKFIKDDIKIDAYLELSKNNLIPFICIRTHKNVLEDTNQTLLYKFLTNKFADITYDDINMTCTLIYKDGNSKEMLSSTIIFDSNSSSAYGEFKKNLNTLLNLKYETEYYPSGREMYVGEVLYKKDENNTLIERIPHGIGTFYYDIPGHKIKYTGELENGFYDGSGKFYNIDNRISLVAKNISSGIMTQKGKLHINYSKKTETIDINFNDMWSKLNILDKAAKKTFILSDNFVTILSKSYWYDTDSSIESIMFYDKSSNDKIYELWDNMNKTNLKIDKLSISMNNMNSMTCLIYRILLISILINLVLIFIMLAM